WDAYMPIESYPDQIMVLKVHLIVILAKQQHKLLHHIVLQQQSHRQTFIDLASSSKVAQTCQAIAKRQQ
ncbi:unnamed protein product, partial [Ilex paraguariensis]